MRSEWSSHDLAILRCQTHLIGVEVVDPVVEMRNGGQVFRCRKRTLDGAGVLEKSLQAFEAGGIHGAPLLAAIEFEPVFEGCELHVDAVEVPTQCKRFIDAD